MTIEKIAVIGLGAMGNSLAALLLKAGYQVTGYDIDPRQIKKLVKQGLKPAKSAAASAKNNDLIILSLPNWSIVETVVEGNNGLLRTLKKGQIVIDTSTVPPHETKSMAAKLAKKGIEWMDVPISGAANQARVGNMVFMAGGKKAIFNKVKPVLDDMGKKTVYIGKNGDAAQLKLVVNQTLFLNQAAAVEGLTLGLKAGLNPEVMLEVLTSGAAGSDLLSARGEDMLNNNFKPKGALWIAIKDLRMALESARQHGVVLPIAGLYQQLMLSAHYDGWDDSDATVVMKKYAQMSGIKRKAGSARLRKKKK
jgi:3-hydroxyisobutyrate dehydrogenase-like beta-hydroxyacid dehydrogenase